MAVFPTMYDFSDILDKHNMNIEETDGWQISYANFLFCIAAKMFGYNKKDVIMVCFDSLVYWDISTIPFMITKYIVAKSAMENIYNFNYSNRPNLDELFEFAEEMSEKYTIEVRTHIEAGIDKYSIMRNFFTMYDFCELLRKHNINIDHKKGWTVCYTEYILCGVAKMYGYSKGAVESVYPDKLTYWDIATPSFMVVKYDPTIGITDCIASNDYQQKSYISFMLTPKQAKESKELFHSITEDMSELYYDIDADIRELRKMLSESGIVGAADNYISRL